MDPDLVTQRLISGLVLLGAAAAVGLLATWLVGWICRRAHLPGGLTLLAQVLTPVESKDEHLNYTSSGTIGWNRSLWATVRFDGSDGPTQAVLWLDAATFDGLRPGSPIDVRYVSWFPHIARPASESTRSLLPWRWLVRVVLAGAAGVAIWLLLRRRSPLLMFLTFVAAIVAGAMWLIMPAPWLPPLAAPVLTAQAEVVRVQTVTRSFVGGPCAGELQRR